MRLKIILEPSDEGGFTVYVPALPGCISEGKTLDDAKRNIREAIELYLEDGKTGDIAEGAVIDELVV